MASRLVTLYCCRCGTAQILPTGAKPVPCVGREPREPCGGGYFSTEPPPVAERPLTWTENDRRFLARLRIAIDEDCASPRPKRT